MARRYLRKGYREFYDLWKVLIDGDTRSITSNKRYQELLDWCAKGAGICVTKGKGGLIGWDDHRKLLLEYQVCVIFYMKRGSSKPGQKAKEYLAKNFRGDGPDKPPRFSRRRRRHGRKDGDALVAVEKALARAREKHPDLAGNFDDIEQVLAVEKQGRMRVQERLQALARAQAALFAEGRDEEAFNLAKR